MSTLQKRMKEKLEKTGIPYKNIEVYGSQIVVTSWSLEAANKWSVLLSNFAKVRKTIHTKDYAKENKNTTLTPTTIEVYRTFAVIK